MKEEIQKEFNVRAEPEKPAVTLDKRAIMTISIVVFSALAFMMMPGNKSKEVEEEKVNITASDPNKNGIVLGLPDGYDKLPKPKVREIQQVVAPDAPEVKLAKVERKESELEKLLRAEAINRFKRQMKAQTSGFTMAGFSQASRGNPDRTISAQGGGNPPIGGSSISELRGSLGALQGGSDRDEANRQDDKIDFLEDQNLSASDIDTKLEGPSSKYEVMAGTVIPGMLITGINTDLPGRILGQVTQNVFDTKEGDHLLIPQGAKVIGSYDSKITYGQERVLIRWERLTFPNGNSIVLKGMPGADMSGYSGLTDEVHNHWGRVIGGILVSSILSAGTQLATGPTNSFNPSFEELAAQGAAREFNQAGQEITRKNINIQPTLTVEPGFRFQIFVTQDLNLIPYQES